MSRAPLPATVTLASSAAATGPVGRRIEMAQRAAERAAVAGLAVPDLGDGLVHQRAALAHQIGEFDVALARHRADLQRAVLLADIAQAVDAIEIDDVVGSTKRIFSIGISDWPPASNFALSRPPAARRRRRRARIVIGKGGWLHAGLCGSRNAADFDSCQKLGTNSKT